MSSLSAATPLLITAAAAALGALWWAVWRRPTSSPPPPGSSGRAYVPLTVAAKSRPTADSVLLQVGHPGGLQLRRGRHVMVRVDTGAERPVACSYTPISDHPGAFELLFRVYPEGKVTPVLDGLGVGDTIHVRYPTGRFTWQAGRWRRVALLSGGTGITPGLQVLRKTVEAVERGYGSDSDDSDDSDGSDEDARLQRDSDIRWSMLCAHRSCEQVLCADVLQDLCEELGPARLRVRLQLSAEGRGAGDAAVLQEWAALPNVTISMGHRTDREAVAAVAGEPGDDVLVCVCGPRGFNEVVRELLADLGHENVHVF